MDSSLSSLPSLLYTAWRSSQPDPTAHPSWGNLESEQRQAWEAVAIVARAYVTEKCASMLGRAAVSAYEGSDRDVDLADGYAVSAALLRSS